MKAYGYLGHVDLQLDPCDPVEAEMLRRCVAYFLARAESALNDIETDEPLDTILAGIKQTMANLAAAEDVVVASQRVLNERKAKAPEVEEEQ